MRDTPEACRSADGYLLCQPVERERRGVVTEIEKKVDREEREIKKGREWREGEKEKGERGREM